MREAQSWYDELKAAEYRKYKDQVEWVLRESKQSIFDQRILAMKTLSSKLEDDEAFTFRKEDAFGFNEILVNRLMLLAFLIGRRDIDKTSYDKGYEAAWADVRKRLGIEEEE
jgi:hypothetical protein